MIVFVSSGMIAVFLVFAVGLVYQAYLSLQGIMIVISGVIFIAEIVACCTALIAKTKNHFSIQRGPTITDIMMTLISSILILFVTNLFLCDLRSYGDGILDMIYFIISILLFGALWVGTLGEWIIAISDDRFSYSGFLRELIGVAIILFLVYGL